MFYAETLPCKAKKLSLLFSLFQGRTIQPAWLPPRPLPLKMSSLVHENKNQLQALLTVKSVQVAPVPAEAKGNQRV